MRHHPTLRRPQRNAGSFLLSDRTMRALRVFLVAWRAQFLTPSLARSPRPALPAAGLLLALHVLAPFHRRAIIMRVQGQPWRDRRAGRHPAATPAATSPRPPTARGLTPVRHHLCPRTASKPASSAGQREGGSWGSGWTVSACSIGDRRLGLPPSLVSHPQRAGRQVWRLEGLSANAIALELNKRGVATPTGSPWSAMVTVIRCGGGWRRCREYGGKGQLSGDRASASARGLGAHPRRRV